MDVGSPLTYYRDSRLVAAANVISIMVSCLLPTLSIVVLYYVSNPAAKLGVIVSFNALFSLTLGIVTRCRRIEIFAASAA
jgi:hypothetical protein